MKSPAARVIEALRLEPLPHEGGFFRVQWVSGERDVAGRPAAGLIWFLVTPDGFSALHRLDASETWEFHAGDPVEHVQLALAGGAPVVTRLGGGESATRVRRVTVPAGVWQGARLAGGAGAGGGACGWALASCLMRPAWCESGFVRGDRVGLRRVFPAAAEWISALTR